MDDRLHKLEQALAKAGLYEFTCACCGTTDFGPDNSSRCVDCRLQCYYDRETQTWVRSLICPKNRENFYEKR